MEEFALCDVKGSGALYQVTMMAKGLRKTAEENVRWKDLSYMEACMRAYTGGSKEPLMLSSGLEDYFLGTYYFNKGRYATPVAGLTHFNKEENEFSAYRFHEDDPVFFHPTSGIPPIRKWGVFGRAGDMGAKCSPPTSVTWMSDVSTRRRLTRRPTSIRSPPR